MLQVESVVQLGHTSWPSLLPFSHLYVAQLLLHASCSNHCCSQSGIAHLRHLRLDSCTFIRVRLLCRRSGSCQDRSTVFHARSQFASHNLCSTYSWSAAESCCRGLAGTSLGLFSVPSHVLTALDEVPFLPFDRRSISQPQDMLVGDTLPSTEKLCCWGHQTQ